MKLKLSRLMHEVEQRIERGDTFRLALGLALLAVGGKNFRVLHNMMAELDQVLSDEEMIQDWKALEIVAEVLVSPDDSDIVMALNQLWENHDATFQLADEDQAEREREAIEVFTRKVRPNDSRLPENKNAFVVAEGEQLVFDVGLVVRPMILDVDGIPRQALSALTEDYADPHEDALYISGSATAEGLRKLLTPILDQAEDGGPYDPKIQILVDYMDLEPRLEAIIDEAQALLNRYIRR